MPGIRGTARGDVTVEFRSKDGITPTIKRIQQGEKGIAAEADKATGAMNKIGGNLRNVKSGVSAVHGKLLLWGAAITGTIASLKQLVDSAREGAVALQMTARVDRMGLREEADALAEGLRNSLDTTSIEQATILLGRAGLALEDIRTIGEAARLEAIRDNRAIGEVIKRYSESFASGRVSSLRMGKTVQDVLATMRREIMVTGDTVGGGLVEAMDQAGAGWDNFWSDVNATWAQIIVGATKSREELVRLHLAEKGIRGTEAALLQERESLLTQMDSLEARQAAVAALTGKQSDAYARLQDEAGTLALRILDVDDRLTALDRTQRLAADSAGDVSRIWGTLTRGAWDYATAVVAANQGLRALLEGAGRGAALGALPDPRPRGGGRQRPSLIAGEDATYPAMDPSVLDYLQARTVNQGNVRRDPAQVAFADPTRERDSRNALSAVDIQTEALERLQRLYGGVASSASGLAGSMADMWSSLGDATGSKRAIAVMKGFRAASIATDAIYSAFQGGIQIAEGIRALSPVSPNYGYSAVHFASAAAFFAQAGAKGASIAGLYSGGGGSGGGAGGGRAYTPPPDYSRRERSEASAPITIYIQGPAMDTPEFRQVVTEAARQGARQGYSGSRL